MLQRLDGGGNWCAIGVMRVGNVVYVDPKTIQVAMGLLHERELPELPMSSLRTQFKSGELEKVDKLVELSGRTLEQLRSSFEDPTLQGNLNLIKFPAGSSAKGALTYLRCLEGKNGLQADSTEFRYPVDPAHQELALVKVPKAKRPRAPSSVESKPSSFDAPVPTTQQRDDDMSDPRPLKRSRVGEDVEASPTGPAPALYSLEPSDTPEAREVQGALDPREPSARETPALGDPITASAPASRLVVRTRGAFSPGLMVGTYFARGSVPSPRSDQRPAAVMTPQAVAAYAQALDNVNVETLQQSSPAVLLGDYVANPQPPDA